MHYLEAVEKQQDELGRLRAENTRFKSALIAIDAHDPEWQGIESLSFDAAKGLIMRMGEIARTALEQQP